MKRAPKSTTLSLRTYPSWWQERYRDEMETIVESLLKDGQSSARISINLLRGSFRARLLGTGAPISPEFWSRRAKTGILIAALPWFVIIPLIGVFSANGGESGVFHGNMNVQLSQAGIVARNLESIIFDLLMVSLIIVVLGWSRLRNAMGEDAAKKRLPWISITVAIIGAALVLISTQLPHHLVRTTSCHFVDSRNTRYCSTLMRGSSDTRLVAYIGLSLIVVAFVLAPFVIAQEVRGGEIPIKSLRSSSRTATALSALFVTMTLAVAACAVAASMQPTPLKGSSYLTWRSTLGGWNVPLVLAFAMMSIVSCLGTFASRRAYKRISALTT